MEKQTKQLVVFALAILLVIGWALWPRPLERRILKHHDAADFSTVERFQVLWTPPNAVRDYDAGAYPQWMLEETFTQPILEILQRATISCPRRRNWQAIGDEGNYNLVAWCFNLHINQDGTVQVWNTNYRMDRTSFEELWAILRQSTPETY